MLSERAFQKLTNRKTKVASYYLDATLFGDYWGWFDKRFYHHTGAVSTWCEEGRHPAHPALVQRATPICPQLKAASHGTIVERECLLCLSAAAHGGVDNPT